jgi:hypothetical protein
MMKAISGIGPSRHIVPPHHLGRIRSEADVRKLLNLADLVENDPQQTLRLAARAGECATDTSHALVAVA